MTAAGSSAAAALHQPPLQRPAVSAGAGAGAGAGSGMGAGVGARGILWAGSLLALLVLGLLTAFVVYEQRARLKAQTDLSTLLTRMLEDHATRSLDGAAITLAALGEVVMQSRVEGDGNLAWILNQAVASSPMLRSVSVLQPDGRILASTEAGLRLRQLDVRLLGALPEVGHDTLGTYTPGRGLQALLLDTTQRASSPSGVGFVPLIKTLRAQSGQELLLLGLINPDALANHQQQMVADHGAHALLLSLGGEVLAATAGSAAQPGAKLAALPIWTRYFPRLEHGSYTGEGSAPQTQLVSFRTSRTRPMMVVVEKSREAALAPWKSLAQQALALGLLVTAMIALLTTLAARNLLAREIARRQRDQAQAQVVESERELSVIVDSVQELLFHTDAQGRLEFTNPRWSTATLLRRDQLLGLALSEVVHSSCADAAAALFRAEAGQVVRSGLLRLGLPGAERDFDVAVMPLFESGELKGYAGSAVDVTEQLQAQTKLRTQLAFTELLLEAMPLPMSTLDREGRYRSVNQAWEEFMGHHRDEVLGRPASAYHTPAIAAQHIAIDQRLLEHGGRHRYEARRMTRLGSPRDLLITKAAIPGEDGKPHGILVAFIDVTEIREAERATRAARDAAETSVRMKTEFLANISHELRTPLQSILGFSELGQARAGEQRRLAAMFSGIHASGLRMLALVNDLLDVAKIESPVGPIHLERTDLRALARDVAAEFLPQLAARSLHLDLRLSSEALWAKVDSKRLQQVVRNVLANAIRYSPEGAQVLLEAYLDPDNRIRISVVDQGPGIPPAEIEVIFEPFVQSSATKDGSGGTGLGLAICRKIMTAHGGEVVAENNPGPGATFHIYVPPSLQATAPSMPARALLAAVEPA